jgi:hypothetical protein
LKFAEKQVEQQSQTLPKYFLFKAWDYIMHATISFSRICPP